MKTLKIFKSTLLFLAVCICASSCGSASKYEDFTYKNDINSVCFCESKAGEEIEELLTSYSSVFVLCGKPNSNSVIQNSKKSSLTYSSAKLVLASYYYFKMDGITVTGELYTSPDISESELTSKIYELQANIENGEILSTYQVNSNARNPLFVNVTGDWEEYDIRYVSVVMSDDGVYYGDFAEWRTIYKLTDSSYNEYYAFINESYITPNPDKTDYRTDKIIYQFTPDAGGAAYLRNYAPKTSADVSTYVPGSPIVYDSGNMAQNYAELQMIYLNTFDNAGEYYRYNTAMSYQSATFLIIVPASTTNDIIIHNDRIIGIQRDSVFINKLVDFEFSTKITMDR